MLFIISVLTKLISKQLKYYEILCGITHYFKTKGTQEASSRNWIFVTHILNKSGVIYNNKF